MTRISIITPSYNQAAYLENTIRSVLAQDCPDLEYIIVDGGSDDGSLEIIERYQERLAWWISEPDEGQAQAINKGIQGATGEFIAWLNSDDLYLPGAVNQALACLSANPALGMVFGDAITIDSAGKPLTKLTFGDWGLLELMSFYIICQPAVFMRRTTLENLGGLDSSYHYMLDHQLWLRLASIAAIQHKSSTWAAARHHPAAKNVNQASGFAQETQRILRWLEAQPELAEILGKNHRRIQAGAYRLTGRYLLDGNQPAASLSAYFKALLNRPGYTLKHWHRMVYAVLSLIGAGGIADDYYRIKRSRKSWRKNLSDPSTLQGWPGLDLDNS